MDVKKFIELGQVDRREFDLGDVRAVVLPPKTEELVVEPKTEEQVFEGADKTYFDKVTVGAVTNAIDRNITPLNIRRGVSVLGVEGNLEPDKPNQSKAVSPKTSEQVVVADNGYELESVTISAVTSDIDSNILSGNIRSGVSILGVEGNLEPDKPNQEKSVQPSESEQRVVADTGYELEAVNVGAIHTENLSVSPSTEVQTFRASDGKYIKEVEVGAIEDLKPEISEQETSLAELEGAVNELSDKPMDKLQWKCDNMKNLNNEFNGYKGTIAPPLAGLNTSNVTSMGSMFYGCSKLTSLDLSNLDTSNVTYMGYMFYICSMLENINVTGWNTSSLTDASRMFYQCDKLKSVDLSGFDMSKATNINEMFYRCKSLTSLDLSNWDVSNVKTIYYLFAECHSLTDLKLKGWNLSKVTDSNGLTGMFNYCQSLTNLDLSGWNTSNIKKMSYMFQYCKKLESLNITGWDTSNVTEMTMMFFDCLNLNTIIGNIDMVKITNSSNTYNMFVDCTNLTNIMLKNIRATYFGITQSQLNDESIINTIQELWDNSNNEIGTTATLDLSDASNARTEAIYVKLVAVTDEMRANDQYIDKKKPCVVCESTDEGAMTLKEYAISKNWQIA